MNLARYYVRKIKQKLKLNPVPSRPVLDCINFGSEECVILDVGACEGGFAGDILLRAPLATVYCFEPNHDLCTKLREVVKSFGTNLGRQRCHVVEVGVGENNVKREFIVSSFYPGSSFLTIDPDKTEKHYPDINFLENKRYSVDVIRLDSYLHENNIKNVKLLKLDIQGFELFALKRCGERIRDIEYIVCEVNFLSLYRNSPIWTEVISYLRAFKFQPIVMDGFVFDTDGNPLQADILFSRNKN